MKIYGGNIVFLVIRYRFSLIINSPFIKIEEVFTFGHLIRLRYFSSRFQRP